MRLLAPFGETKAFNMLRDHEGKSKGNIVFEYHDADIASGVLSSLNGLMLGELDGHHRHHDSSPRASPPPPNPPTPQTPPQVRSK